MSASSVGPARLLAACLAASAALASASAAARAGDDKPSPPETRPEDADPLVDPVPPLVDDAASKARGKKAGSGAPLTAKAAGPDAGKTETSRTRYLAQFLDDLARDGRSAFLDAAARDSIDASIAALPAACPAGVRKSIAEARRLAGLGKWIEAQALAQQVLALDDRNVAARLVAARAVEAQGRADDAISTQLAQAVAADLADPWPRHLRGIVEWRIGRLDEARTDLVKATTLRPGDGRLSLSLGVLDLERGAPKDATISLLAAADARPGDPIVWRALAHASVLTADWTGAAASFERVVRLVEGEKLPPGQVPAEPRPPALNERLCLALVYADHLHDRDRAAAHARAFAAGGGVDLALDEWLRRLVKD